MARRTFAFKNPGEGANALCYSRDGALLVVGLDAGYVHILEAQDLSDVHSARNTTAAILKMSMCVTGGVLAVADASHQVLLYAYLPYKHIKRWEFVGEWRAHAQAGAGSLQLACTYAHTIAPAHTFICTAAVNETKVLRLTVHPYAFPCIHTLPHTRACLAASAAGKIKEVPLYATHVHTNTHACTCLLGCCRQGQGAPRRGRGALLWRDALRHHAAVLAWR